MKVSEIDKQVLNGTFIEKDGMPLEHQWLLTHLSGHGIKFGIYYVKMRQLWMERGEYVFESEFLNHIGNCYRQLLQKWFKLLQDLEKKVAEATAAKDYAAVVSLKKGPQAIKYCYKEKQLEKKRLENARRLYRERRKKNTN